MNDYGDESYCLLLFFRFSFLFAFEHHTHIRNRIFGAIACMDKRLILNAHKHEEKKRENDVFIQRKIAKSKHRSHI